MSGKTKVSLKNAIEEVKNANSIDEITDCKKLKRFERTYRIRLGSYSAFFNCHIEVENGIAKFEYLVPRVQAYSKEILKNLKDNEK